MLDRLNEYDWKEAFGAAGKEKDTALNELPVCVQFAEPVSTEPFDREDVAEIIAISDGEKDSENWLGVFRLKDGRYAMIDAGCDYTGWGCREWGTAEVCRTLNEMIRYGLSDGQRRRLGLYLDSEKVPLKCIIDGENLIIRKYEPGCHFCDATDELVSISGKLICRPCGADVLSALHTKS